jgi:hypothetical protein
MGFGSAAFGAGASEQAAKTAKARKETRDLMTKFFTGVTCIQG